MKAAIIGAGFISDFHADAYLSVPNMELCAICDINPVTAARQAEKYHCHGYTDAKEMLCREKPDVVSVCVPTFLHERYVLMALAQGADVLCEKPFTLTMESACRMQEAAQKSHRMLMTAQVLRWWPEYVEIRKQMTRLGTPLMVSTQRLQHANNGTWLNDPQKGGGVLFDLFIHDLDFLCSILGYEPTIEIANGTLDKTGAYNRVFVLLHWSSGCYAKLESANQMPVGYPFTATLRADYKESCIQYAFEAPVNIEKDAVTKTNFLLFDKGEVQRLSCCAEAQTKAFNDEIAAFVQGVQTGVNPIPTENTLKVMKLIHQIKTHLE